MNNILVATDYSQNADYAVGYAAELAEKLGSNLIIFHAYHFPPINPRTEFTQDLWLYSKQNENNIKELAGIIRRKYNVSVEGIARQGLAVDEINALIKERRIDLVVMGINWNKFISNILGTTTSVMIEKTCCPILAIPGETKFKPYDQIVLATDYKEIEDSFDFQAFKNIVNIHNSKLSVLNVNTFNKLPVIEQAIMNSRLGKILGVEDFTYEFVENKDVVKGIIKFLIEKRPDLLVMLSRKHELIEKILQPSFTKKMIGKTPVPLLVLPQLNEAHKQMSGSEVKSAKN